MKLISGFLLIIVGLVLGVYVGLWLCFIGGIMQIIDAVVANPIDTLSVGYGILRILLSTFLGWLTAVVFAMPGLALLKNA